jgi:putative glycosyltransferase (TIGR04372 family)
MNSILSDIKNRSRQKLDLISSDNYEKTYNYFQGHLPKALVIIIEVIHFIFFKVMCMPLPIVKSKLLSFRIVKAYLLTNVMNEKEYNQLQGPSVKDSIRRVIANEYRIERLILDRVESEENVSLPLINQMHPVEIDSLLTELSIHFWNSGHQGFKKEIKRVKELLTNTYCSKENLHLRYLPDFVTNFGHLGFLFLYLNYYQIHDKNRIVVLPNRKTPNDFLLELIRRHSRIPIQDLDENVKKMLNPCNTDWLSMSRERTGTYRIESSAGADADQEFPEFSITQDLVLRLSEEENEIGFKEFSEFVGREISWFALLHVRGPRNNYMRFSQARDASILQYNLLCRRVAAAGGIVIRNGSRDFLSLPSDFEAFDYAYSSIKSPFMDVWLNANCAFWIGNSNGASVVPIAFGKPRLITDAWFIDENGPSYDYFAPKNLYKDGKRLSDSEVKVSSVGRCMNRKWLRLLDYDLQELTPKQLEQSIDEFLEFAVEQKFLTPPLSGVNLSLLDQFKEKPNKMKRIYYDF